MSDNPDPSGNIPIRTDRSKSQLKDPDDQDKSTVKLAQALIQGIKMGANAIVSNFSNERMDPSGITVEEKEYMIDPDEINELFRNQQQNNGGLIVQIVLLLTIMLYILVDTIQIPGIAGTLRAVEFATDTLYIEQLFQKDLQASKVVLEQELKDRQAEAQRNAQTATGPPTGSGSGQATGSGSGPATGSATGSGSGADTATGSPGSGPSPGASGQQEARFQAIIDLQQQKLLKVQQNFSYDASSLEDQTHEIEDALSFIRTTEDFLEWFNFVLYNLYTPVRNSDVPGLFMMDSTYYMGSRLLVKNAQKASSGNLQFKDIHQDVRVFPGGYDGFDSIQSEYYDQTAFENITHDGEDAVFEQFFSQQLEYSRIKAIYDGIFAKNVISNDVISIRYEMMFYSNDASLGTLVRFDFFKSNAGILKATRNLLIFQPKNNGNINDITVIRAIIEITFVVSIVFNLYRMVNTYRMKCRQLISYKLNDFQIEDLLGTAQLISGAALLATGFNLLFSEIYSYRNHFKLPVESYDEYLLWVDNAELYETYRIELGVFVILQVTNLLFVASAFFPSLGILFQTINKSMTDIITFTAIYTLFFAVFIVITFISFGEHVFGFSSITLSAMTVYQMFLGEFPYTAMFSADPQVSALVLIIFVFSMNFLIINMYTAIVIRTYNKLQARMLFLGESVAVIIAKRTKKRFKNYVNFLCCRSTFKKPKQEKNNFQAQNRGLLDEPEERSGNQKITQRIQQNWSKIWQTKIITKEKFERELKAAAKQITLNRKKEEWERIQQMSGGDAEQSAKSFSILKNGFILLIHLLVSFFFYIEFAQSDIRASIRSSINNYIELSTFDSNVKILDIQSGYFAPINQLLQYDYEKIGFQRQVGPTGLRVTFRKYSFSENGDDATNKIFPNEKKSKFSLHSQVTKAQSWEQLLTARVLQLFEVDSSEETDNVAFAGIEKIYTEKSGEFDSFYDEGGFVFEFDKDRNMIKNEGEQVITLDEFLTKTIEEKNTFNMGIIGTDWVMYNPNYDFLVYSAIVFSYKPNGELETATQVLSFPRTYDSFYLSIFTVWLLFYLYFTIRLFKDLWKVFTEQISPPKANVLSALPGRVVEDDKTCWGKFIQFIGIDESRLVGQNFLVVLVLCIIMIMKRLIVSAINFVRTVATYSASNILNFFELISTLINSTIIFYLVQAMPLILFGDELNVTNPDLLKVVNKICYINNEVSWLMSFSIFFLSFRMFKLLAFSLEVNLPIATLIHGRKDILNILFIIFIFTLGNSLASFIIFSPAILEYSTLTGTIYVVFKMYLGDFSIVPQMTEVQPITTLLYLGIIMTVYSIFLVQIFLGIVVGHFEVEWHRVEAIHNFKKDQSYNVIAIIFRILKTHFTNEAKKLELKEKLNPKEELDEDAPKSRCTCPCTLSSFNPSGMFERIVLYCMMRVCKKKDKVDQEVKDEDEESEDDLNDNAFKDTQESKSTKASAGADPNQPRARMPFNSEFGWGTPKALKASSEFRSQSAVKTYLNWFDGWAVNLFQQDTDTLEYFKRNNIDKGYQIKKAIPDSEILELQQRKPQSIQGILNLETHWNDEVDEYEKANSNFWMFHLEKQVYMLTKKEYSLENFKSMDAFFTSGLINKEDSIHKLSVKQKEIFQMDEDAQLEFFGSQEQTTEQKYMAWKAIDLVYRYTLQEKSFARAQQEKEELKAKIDKYKRENPGENDEGRGKDFSKDYKHRNLMSLLIAQIERPVDESMAEKEQMLHPQFAVSKMAKKTESGKSVSNPLKFNVIKSQNWRARKYHRVYELLIEVWRTKLTTREKFEFWFKYFTTMERVRLWNCLVFTREWFRRVIQFSRRQDKYKEAVERKDKLIKEKKQMAQRKEKEKAAAALEAAEEGQQPPSDDTEEEEKQDVTYKGFHRRDLNRILKEYASQMYYEGVRDEELLLIKVKMELEEYVERQYIGNVSSFFNQEKGAKIKDEEAKLDEQKVKLSHKQELQKAREIFTADEMLRIWNQFFLGNYKLRERKKDRNRDKGEESDCLDGEYKFEIEPVQKKAQSGNTVEEQNEKLRTMDRYEQIHYFFQSMVEHNNKTLKSCQIMRDEEYNWFDIDDDLEVDVDDVAEGDIPLRRQQTMTEDRFQAIKKNSKKHSVGHGKQSEMENYSINQKLKLFKDVRELVIDEEERLPLWMLMSQREKLDMLAHECIDQEAQIMNFLIEVEYGAENNFRVEGKNLKVDILLEDALNQMIFQKYLAYTRLQATFYARKFTEDLIAKTQNHSFELYDFAKYLNKLQSDVVRNFDKNNKQIEKQKLKNEEREAQLREQAFQAEQKLFTQTPMPQKKAEKAALAIKFTQMLQMQKEMGMQETSRSRRDAQSNSQRRVD